MRKRKTVMMQLMTRIVPLVALLMAAVMAVTLMLINTTVREITESELKKEAYGNQAVLDKSISEDLSSLELIKAMIAK